MSTTELGSRAAAAASRIAKKGRRESLPTNALPIHLGSRRKPLRVCVLSSTYEGTNSATSEYDNFICGPHHWVKSKQNYEFSIKEIKKADSYRQIRELITSRQYDVFFNLCDGGKDEQRAGVDVLRALEENNAAYTGTDSVSFEPNKIDMKILVSNAGVRTPNFAFLHSSKGIDKACRHLKFPVIVKHVSGYASVGIFKDNRCDNMEQLEVKLKTFIPEYHHALVEEFIRGKEGTVLVCRDPESPNGIKVFKPMLFSFLKDADDFAHFENKWTGTWEGLTFDFVEPTDPSYATIVDMARNAFRHVMQGVGYGRCDFRIDENGHVYFLEINPNCGMWYEEKHGGGDFADHMVKKDPTWNHDKFVQEACRFALEQQRARQPWFVISHDSQGHFTTRASVTVDAGRPLFGDLVHPIPVIARALYQLGTEDKDVGCVVSRGDGLAQNVALRHSCDPNMVFMQGQTLTLVAKRQINRGEELTVDYATLRDPNMPRFACRCGTVNCHSVIFPTPPTMRVADFKALKRLLRERKRLAKEEAKLRKQQQLQQPISNSTSTKPNEVQEGVAGAVQAGGKQETNTLS